MNKNSPKGSPYLNQEKRERTISVTSDVFDSNSKPKKSILKVSAGSFSKMNESLETNNLNTKDEVFESPLAQQNGTEELVSSQQEILTEKHLHFGEDDNYPPEIPYRESTNKNLEFLNKNIILLCLSVILGAVMIAVTVGVTTTFEPTQTPANEFCDRLINSPQIKLANGLTILGKIDAEFPDLVYAFDTVPYGLPPTEDLRFSKPRNMPNVTAYDSHLLWNGTGSYRSCIQPKKLDSQFSEQTESCLFVNIYTPMEFTSDSNFPVLVDFHGGGFIAGSNTLNSGSHLAAVQKIVVVVVNYRLGAFGFWLDPSFQPNDSNFGYLDQRASLAFVQNNIDRFGGNPEEVTIIGCSAGGQSVTFHTSHEDSYKYFKRAIVLSAPTGIPYYRKEEAVQKYAAIGYNVTCCLDNKVSGLFPRCKTTGFPYQEPYGVNMTCMREKDWQDIRDGSISLSVILGGKPNFKITQLIEPLGPVIEGFVVQNNPYSIFTKNINVHKVPMIFEVTADESLPFADVFENSIDLLTWEAVLTYTFGSEDGKRIYYLYKEYCSYGALDTGGQTCSDELNFQQFMTDYLSLCNQRSMLISLIKTGFNPFIYGVFFNATAPKEWQEKNPDSKCSGQHSCHALGNWYFFSKNIQEKIKLSDEEKTFQEVYQNYYSNFIRTGNPNNFEGNPTKNNRNVATMSNWQLNSNWFEMAVLDQRTTDWFDKNDTQQDVRCNILDELNAYMDH